MAGHQEILASVPLFARLQRSTIERLDQIMVERRYDTGADIVKEGEGGIGFFIIADGSAEVLRGPSQAPVGTLKKGAYFGEMAMVDDHPRSVTIRAAEPTTCLVLTRWHFLAELKSDPEIAINLLHTLTQRVRDVESKLNAAEARLAEMEARAKV